MSRAPIPASRRRSAQLEHRPVSMGLLFMRSVGRAAPALVGAVTLLLVGCQGFGGKGQERPKPMPNEVEPERIDTRDDVVSIVQFWSQQPWLREDARTLGFRVPTYFISAVTEKGVFVNGTIFVWLYELGPATAEGEQRIPLQQWEFTPEQAMGFRVRKEALGGYYYGFVLKWDPALRLERKRLEIQFGYERVSDKKLILSRPKQLQPPSASATIQQPGPPPPPRPAPRRARPEAP